MPQPSQAAHTSCLRHRNKGLWALPPEPSLLWSHVVVRVPVAWRAAIAGEEVSRVRMRSPQALSRAQAADLGFGLRGDGENLAL